MFLYGETLQPQRRVKRQIKETLAISAYHFYGVAHFQEEWM